MRRPSAALLLLLALPTAGALVPVPQAHTARVGEGDFSGDFVAAPECSDTVGVAGLTYGFAGDQWELRTYTVMRQPLSEVCGLPWLEQGLYPFPTDISAGGAVARFWLSGGCGEMDFVVHPFPTAGPFLLTVDYEPPAGCPRFETHLRWSMTVT